MSPHAEPFPVALQALLFITAHWRGWLPIRCGSWNANEYCWRQGPHQDLTGLIRHLDETGEDTIELGMPQNRPENGGVSQASVLWARISGEEQLRRARALRPLPTMVLQEGTTTRRWLLWALEAPVSYFDVVAANRKIAYSLHARQKDGDPDRAWLPAPGTNVRNGSRPTPVRVTRLTTDFYDVPAVVGWLREPPAKDAWMAAAR